MHKRNLLDSTPKKNKVEGRAGYVYQVGDSKIHYNESLRYKGLGGDSDFYDTRQGFVKLKKFIGLGDEGDEGKGNRYTNKVKPFYRSNKYNINLDGKYGRNRRYDNKFRHNKYNKYDKYDKKSGFYGKSKKTFYYSRYYKKRKVLKVNVFV